MGFTLRAALDALPPTMTVVVAELVPAVVANAVCSRRSQASHSTIVA